MTALSQRILDIICISLDADLLSKAIVYLDMNLVRAGEQVLVGDVRIDVPWDAYISFVDLEPGVNWGHACVYMLIGQNTDEVFQVEAQMPPFLKVESSTFHFLWRGHLAPEWAVMTNPD